MLTRKFPTTYTISQIKNFPYVTVTSGFNPNLLEIGISPTSLSSAMLEWTSMMGRQKKVIFNVWYKDMRSDVLIRYMKIHKANDGSKCKNDELKKRGFGEIFDWKKQLNIKKQITLGEKMYQILEKVKL